jgi:glycerol-3-phosphate acyltransferase PlsY
MLAVMLFVFGFFCGALPFSVWLGRLYQHADVRRYGDGNPGATNALRLGGWRLGLLVLILDVFKGALPVGLAYFTFGLRGVAMVLVALAPTVGHGYSPFLHWQGGKALAVSLGVWIGLTLGEVPIIILLFLLFWYALCAVDGWAVMAMVAGTLVYLLLNHPDPLLLSICALQALFVAWKHRSDLARRPAWRPWVWRLFPRQKLTGGSAK